MSEILKLADEIIAGRRLTSKDDFQIFLTCDGKELQQGANHIREALCGNHVDLCTIVNGRSGKCSENCKFCAQSAHHHTGVEEYAFLEEETLMKDCRHNAEKGVHRYSIVTAGKTLTGEDFEKAVHAYKRMHEEIGIALCGSHGIMTTEQFKRLKEVGITMVHCNIETSERYFPSICTTHTFADKIANIQRAKSQGLEVCSGGIIGMGETMEDRISMAACLAELGIESIPLNALMPIPGTPFENMQQLTEEEILRTVAIFRYYNPTASVRLAAGRSLMRDSGRQAFLSGANATITGDMLTTSGNNTQEDIAMLQEMGLEI